ncbi:nuclear transport factor 2 family protein [Novosphingobium lentum]|uniref:nuclear transport factor 2 family protein n=1 Tax=Novosphingobium lentum TaxID=145287 RepID=UPI000832D568|nr:nuclear transport factor 2 family protein [Novosphingobium lentum]
MAIEQNKDVVRRYFDAVNSTQPDRVMALLADDFHFKAMLREPDWLGGEMGREKFSSAMVAMSDLMTSPIQMQIVSMTAEDDRVAVEATSYGPMKAGPAYANSYHFVFRVRDEKIFEVLEYSCSYHAAQIFGRFFAEQIFTAE